MTFTLARSLDEALAALAVGARPIAGGTDLVVGHRQGRILLPGRLVAIDRVDRLAAVTPAGDGLSLGATVSHHRLEHDPRVGARWSALADAAALVGSPATRHVGTLGGNVMNASPAMDTGAPLVVLGATVELRSTRGARRMTPAELWAGPGVTTADPDELCIAVHLPAPPDGSAYVRLEYRRAMEIAVVGAAVAVTLGPDGTTVSSVRVALSAVGPTIVEVTGLDELAGPASGPELRAEVVRRSAAQARPISDLRASDAYRRHCVGVMAGRALDAALLRAGGARLTPPVNRSLGIGAAR